MLNYVCMCIELQNYFEFIEQPKSNFGFTRLFCNTIALRNFCEFYNMFII